MTAKIIEKTVPEQITTPIGIQRELPLMIGLRRLCKMKRIKQFFHFQPFSRMRRRPASKAASLGL